MAAYHRAVTDAVRRQGGYVAKFPRRRRARYFGWPEAHEDDAERACAPAWPWQAVGGRAPRRGRSLAARVGIATGPVVVGELLGEGEARERGVVGETPNLAARLQAMAEPGRWWRIGDAPLTGALFDWADLGRHALKGLPGAGVRLAGPRRERGREPLRGAAAGCHAVPLIGREEELELLLRPLAPRPRWRGPGRACCAARPASASRAWPRRCGMRSTARIAGGVHPLLLAAARRQRHCAPSSRAWSAPPASRPMTRRRRACPSWRRCCASGAAARGCGALCRAALCATLGRWPTLDLSPQRRREQLLRALLRRVRALAARRPVLMVVEDAHWIDPTTRELLDLLVAEAPTMALLLGRHAPPRVRPGCLARPAPCDAVQLNRLARRSRAPELLRRSPAARRCHPKSRAGSSWPDTDGVPLFVEEVAVQSWSPEYCARRPDRWVRRVATAAGRAEQPAGLAGGAPGSALLRARGRAGGCGDRPRICATTFSWRWSGLPEPPLRGRIENALSRGPTSSSERGVARGSLDTFRHALIRDAAHGTLLRRRRCDLHRSAAIVILRLRPEMAEREPELLARHWAEAREPVVAAALYLRAGRRATARSAMQEARAHLSRGLALLPVVADEATRRLEAELQFGTR